MTINATAIILLALYVAVARRQGVDPATLSGTLQNDILKEYIARGTYIYPPRPSLRIVTDIIAFCERALPRWNPISISGYHIREAGSTAVQEVAFTLANAVAYVEAAIDAGLDVNAFGQRLSFFFNAHNNFLEEIAKFRAARRLWARIMRDRFGATNPRAQQLRFHTQTAGSTLTAQQPDNNIVQRGAAGARRGARGHAVAALQRQGRSARAADRGERDDRAADAADHPARERRRGHRRSGRGRVRHRGDDQSHRAGGHRTARSDSVHGRDARRDRVRLYPAADSGLGVRRPAGARYWRGRGGRREPVRGQRRRARRAVFQIDPDIERQQIERVRAVRASRSEADWRAALAAVDSAARGADNLVPVIITAVEKHATLGEMAGTLRQVFGEYRETSP